jgi:hypothetical protein
MAQTSMANTGVFSGFGTAKTILTHPLANWASLGLSVAALFSTAIGSPIMLAGLPVLSIGLMAFGAAKMWTGWNNNNSNLMSASMLAASFATLIGSVAGIPYAPLASMALGIVFGGYNIYNVLFGNSKTNSFSKASAVISVLSIALIGSHALPHAMGSVASTSTPEQPVHQTNTSDRAMFASVGYNGGGQIHNLAYRPGDAVSGTSDQPGSVQEICGTRSGRCLGGDGTVMPHAYDSSIDVPAGVADFKAAAADGLTYEEYLKYKPLYDEMMARYYTPGQGSNLMSVSPDPVSGTTPADYFDVMKTMRGAEAFFTGNNTGVYVVPVRPPDTYTPGEYIPPDAFPEPK